MNRFGLHIILFLTLVSSCSMFLAPGWLLVEQAVAIHKVKEKLECEQLTEIMFSRHSIQWVERGKECLINNRMFDVKELRITGDTVVLLGLYDDQEKQILARLGALPASSRKDQNRAQLIYQITHLVLDCNDTHIISPDVSAGRNHPACPPFPICTRYSAPPFSPPDQA